MAYTYPDTPDDPVITRSELEQALKSVRIWARSAPNETEARLMHVLHPADAANDIFISAKVAREK